MATETGKQRSQRIEIDYYRKRTGLHSLRTICIVLGFAIAALYAVYVLAAGSGDQLSTGPVAVSHASFEQDCSQCHQDFTPISSEAVGIDLELFGVSASDSLARMESSCQKCHAVGDHHRGVMNSDYAAKDQNCAFCHADHQGRLHDLVAISDSKCAVCHQDLNQACTSAPSIRAKVVDFTSQGHGDFASLAIEDSGNVKFDHAQHMMPGQVDADRSKGAFTFGMLSQADRSRYSMGNQSLDTPVQLACASCHEFDGNPDRVNSLISDNELGRYIAAIDFESHCVACHAINPAGSTVDSTPLPHAAPWSQVDLLLAANRSGSQAIGQSRAPRDDTQTTPIPGDGLGDPADTSMRTKNGLSHDVAVAGQSTIDRSAVEANCLKCHDQASISDDFRADASAGETLPLIPARFLSKGLYDHAAHSKVDCRYCHETAYGDGSPSGEPMDHQTVMISGIKSCNGCHRDAESETPGSLVQAVDMLGGSTTWASDNCITCHRYHDSKPGSDPTSLNQLAADGVRGDGVLP